MQPGLIITVNPGATTTRCAFYETNNDLVSCIAEEVIEHSDSELSWFEAISDQLEYRYQLVLDFVRRHINGESNYSPPPR